MTLFYYSVKITHEQGLIPCPLPTPKCFFFWFKCFFCATHAAGEILGMPQNLLAASSLYKSYRTSIQRRLK